MRSGGRILTLLGAPRPLAPSPPSEGGEGWGVEGRSEERFPGPTIASARREAGKLRGTGALSRPYRAEGIRGTLPEVAAPRASTPGCDFTGFQPADSGPKACHVIAWAGASAASGGPGNSQRNAPSPCKGATGRWFRPYRAEGD